MKKVTPNPPPSISDDNSQTSTNLIFSVRPGLSTEAALSNASEMLESATVDEAFLNGLLDLSNLLDEKNFREIVGLLSRVHFYKQASLADFFDWLQEIARRSGKPPLLDKAKKFSHFLRAERDMLERFVL